MSTAISFDIACETLKQLREKELELFISGQGKRFMLLLSQDDSLSLVEFNRKRANCLQQRFAIASLDEGKAVIPVCLDVIYQQMGVKLKI